MRMNKACLDPKVVLGCPFTSGIILSFRKPAAAGSQAACQEERCPEEVQIQEGQNLEVEQEESPVVQAALG